MPRLGTFSGAATIVPIVLILIGGGMLFLPLSPKISGTFTIQSQIIYAAPVKVTLTLVMASYSKQTPAQNLAVGLGVTLPIRPSQAGNYVLRVAVTYGGAPIASGRFYNIDDGTYGFQFTSGINFSESTNTPYNITIQVTGQNVLATPLSFSVYPAA